jgi:uncharacterized membrane protein HdeD (DUF308 family)
MRQARHVIIKKPTNHTWKDDHMLKSMRFNDSYLPDFGKQWSLYLFWGILLTILGILAIGASAWTTIISVFIVGLLVLIAGVVLFIDTFAFWWGKGNGFFLHFILALFYLIVGIMIIREPIVASISLTLLLGIFYVIIGLYRIFMSSGIRSPRWGWALFNGIVSLLLGILILSSWPASGLFIIGIFIGIDLIFSGWTFIMASLAARTMK